MSKYFGIYSNSGAVQTALDESALTNPYVALVSGALDYNTLEPASPYIGEWSDDGEGTYQFTVIDDTEPYWSNEVYIGETYLSYIGAYDTFTITLYRDYISGTWSLKFRPSYPEASEIPEYTFTDNNPEMWHTGISTNESDSESEVLVDYDGETSFSIWNDSSDNPLSITTINPEAPESV